MWSPKPPNTKTYVDYSENLQKAKIQASMLQRQKRIPAIVDFVKSGSRFTVLIPRENAKLTLVLSCIRAPRSARNPSEASEPFGQEAHDFANRKCLQRDVEIEIEGVDKVGGFIGTIYINRENFAKLLLEEGFATVHTYSAEQSPNGAELMAAEKKAKGERKGLWQDYDQSKEEEASASNTSGDVSAAAVKPPEHKYITLSITHIDERSLRLKVQISDPRREHLQPLMDQLQTFHRNSSPLQAPPKAGDVVSAKFADDGLWYRARVRGNDRIAKKAEIVYIDYGNDAHIPWAQLRPLPANLSTAAQKPFATDAVLSYLQFPTAAEYRLEAERFLYEKLEGRPWVARPDFIDAREGNLMYVTLYEEDAAEDNAKGKFDNVNADVVSAGLAMVPRKLKGWETFGKEALDALKVREEEAKKERRGIWEYGDLTEDD